jgi:seryl-tRNA synthetase
MIDYGKISEAIKYYKHHGFKYMEVPWVVEQSTAKITMPEGKIPIDCMFGTLVGSSEQSFLQLVKDKKLSIGDNSRYMACSPCFRNDLEDDIHQKYFMKVELFLPNHENDEQENLQKVLQLCNKFFNRYIPAKVIKTDEGYDIVTENKEIELGSYGIRNYNDLHWIYATGLAEPRLSSQLNRIKGL